MQNMNFEQGDDFIPFTVTPVSDAGSPAHVIGNGGEKDRDSSPAVRERDRENTGANYTPSNDRPRRTTWDQDHSSDREGTKHSGKRKHGIESNGSYGYKKQRLDTSRKAPWVTSVDYSCCSNVAEMCVSRFLVWFGAYFYISCS